MKYNKLIRDKIPEIIKQDNKIPIIHIAENQEYWTKLKEKLIEETNEFINEPTQEELADILEVIDAICDFKHFNKQNLIHTKHQKAIKRGKFQKRIILDEVE
ncbi:nucleoside triphosphate pyrophosphohydrolase [archaeon]|jgi:predicted house-cleaning noncanonical NTP pyrophosphatase (MazG superfamily)|nr:nucleoside triphosphate pyrophosphohydrolase [archaeon]